MKALIIGGKDLKVFSRDRTGLMMNIIMPLLLILVLGSALSNMVSDKAPSIGRFDVGVVDESGAGGSAAVVSSFREVLSQPSLKDLLNPFTMSRDEAESAMRAGKLAGAVVFPKDYAAKIMSGQPASLEVLFDPGASYLKTTILKAVAQGYNDTVLAVQFAMQEAQAQVQAQTQAQAQAQAVPAPEQQLAAEMARRAAELGQQISAKLQAMSPRIREETAKSSGVVNATQYYAITMTVMFLGFAGMTGLQSIIQEKDQRTMGRILAAPGSRLEFVAGKFLGVLFIAASQFIVLMVGTHFIYRVDWGSNWTGLFLLAAAYAITMSGLATLVSATTSNVKAAVTVWMLVIQVITALGGGMVPISQLPKSMTRIASVLPNYWATMGFFDLVSGETLAHLMPTILGLFAIGALSLAAGAWRLARDQERRG